jgi:FKBP-type peptidyl-prolyl cis-trans isomerase
MKKYYFYIIYFLTMLLMSSCLKTDDFLQNQAEEDEKKILAYLSQNNINATRSPTGIYYVITQQGTGKQPTSLSEIANVDIEISLLGGARIVGEKDFTFRFQNGLSINGIIEAASLLKAGGSGRFFLPSERGFGQTSGVINGVNVPANSVLMADVKLHAVRNDEEQKLAENGLIQQYLLDKKLITTRDTMGVFYVRQTEGSGNFIRTANRVTINYKGSLLNGKSFDSGTISFAVGAGAVIQGMDVGMRLMKKGEKGIMIIPSHLAYQDRGRGEVIRPFDPLVFEMEVTNVD